MSTSGAPNAAGGGADEGAGVAAPSNGPALCAKGHSEPVCAPPACEPAAWVAACPGCVACSATPPSAQNPSASEPCATAGMNPAGTSARATRSGSSQRRQRRWNDGLIGASLRRAGAPLHASRRRGAVSGAVHHGAGSGPAGIWRPPGVVGRCSGSAGIIPAPQANRLAGCLPWPVYRRGTRVLRGFGRAPVAQLDRVTVSEAVGRGFESRRARHMFNDLRPHFPIASLVGRPRVTTLQLTRYRDWSQMTVPADVQARTAFRLHDELWSEWRSATSDRMRLVPVVCAQITARGGPSSPTQTGPPAKTSPVGPA